MSEQSNQELLAALGVEVKKEKKAKLTPREERIIAGFEEIQRFVDENGRAPLHGEDRDIFERIYATRLDQIKSQEDCRSLVIEMDHQGLLSGEMGAIELADDIDSDEALLAELGIEAPKEGDVTFLKHVKTRAEKKAAEEIASRDPCEDFEEFKPLFDQVQSELKAGTREAKLLIKNPQINRGDWFILYGQKAYVAEVSEQRIHGFDKNDYRLRVIYDNGTESDLLLRSLQRVLDKDESGRRIIELSAGPLFDDIASDDDLESGTVYVLRSLSEHPMIASNRDVIHKIGVTGGTVEKRIANAKLDPTFLMADVEVVATYQLFNINRTKLEKLIHRFFEEAKLDIEIKDRFGNPVAPQEWFLVPVTVIDEAVAKITDQSISNFKYDPESASIVTVS
ncbi:GIY-YIG nuclease family protein [Neptuniibacter sp.]|uniref:GIY-YIG nuclease family protein n=1 Tax=Neptuniibacter sp. TaxID=1962643 RepID=UPI00260452EA|nr:GIY-YIG nuclease family protein [Neptuniibacter sp.]MCP4597874.1 GIY-YIG nuclease family protein [Neptuniibacter sp.]